MLVDKSSLLWVATGGAGLDLNLLDGVLVGAIDDLALSFGDELVVVFLELDELLFEADVDLGIHSHLHE